MHIPDGFLDAKTAVAATSVSAAGLGFALRQARLTLPPRRVPLMGLAAAFVFAAQMLNFPVAAGTSGHLVGATLAGVLLGPGPGVIVMTSVLIVQALFFADGGILSLGANVFNMAIVGSAGGYFIYRLLSAVFVGARGRLLAASFAAWCSTVVAAIACAGELAASGVGKWSIVFPTMLNVHMIVGAVEALITALVLASVVRTRPELVEPRDANPSPRYRELAVYGLLIALGLALFVSPVASSLPDSIERVATLLGSRPARPLLPSPAPDYRLAGIGSVTLATSIAGAVGTVIVFGLCLLLARVLVPKPQPQPESCGTA